MNQRNSQIKLLEIKVNSVMFISAADKYFEESRFNFKLNFSIMSTQTKVTRLTQKTHRRAIKRTQMDINEELLFFNIDLETENLFYRLVITTAENSKKFKPIVINLKSFTDNKQIFDDLDLTEKNEDKLMIRVNINITKYTQEYLLNIKDNKETKIKSKENSEKELKKLETVQTEKNESTGQTVASVQLIEKSSYDGGPILIEKKRSDKISVTSISNLLLTEDEKIKEKTKTKDAKYLKPLGHSDEKIPKVHLNTPDTPNLGKRIIDHHISEQGINVSEFSVTEIRSSERKNTNTSCKDEIQKRVLKNSIKKSPSHSPKKTPDCFLKDTLKITKQRSIFGVGLDIETLLRNNDSGDSPSPRSPEQKSKTGSLKLDPNFKLTISSNNTMKKEINRKKSLFKNEYETDRLSNSLSVKSESNMTIIEGVSETTQFNVITEEETGEYFCKGFFASGLLNNNKPQIISDSEGLQACCGHKNCSLLPAFKPSVVFRIPQKDNKQLEINELTASICFPYGVKICYAIEESSIKPLTSFSTTITSIDGSRYYMTVLRYFVKYENSEFQKSFNINIVKEYLNFEKFFFLYESNPKLKKKLEVKFASQLEIVTQINYNDFFYVPQCIALISKFPYTNQMEKVLNILMKINLRGESTCLVSQLLHLIKGIPIPGNNNLLSFYMPYHVKSIELPSLMNNDLPLNNYRFTKLIDTLSIEMIIYVFFLLQLEQKILFVGNNYSIISEIIDLFSNLIYPLEYDFILGYLDGVTPLFLF